MFKTIKKKTFKNIIYFWMNIILKDKNTTDISCCTPSICLLHRGPTNSKNINYECDSIL